MNFQNQNVLITGASQGLGRAFGLALANLGAKIVLVARHPEKLEIVVSEIKQAGGHALAIVADVSEKNDIYRIAGQAAEFYGTTDLLINNASTLGPVPLPLLMDTTCEDLEKVLQTNLVGPFRLIKALAGPMILRGHGQIVNISSDAAVEAYPRWGAYGISKAGLAHLTKIFAAELGAVGIKFLSVDPGEMKTQMHHDALPDADPESLANPVDAARKIIHLIKESHDHSH